MDEQTESQLHPGPLGFAGLNDIVLHIFFLD
jgi:hypothetical protein